MGEVDERSVGATAESGPSSSSLRASARVQELVLVMAGGAYASARRTLGDRKVVVGREPSGDAAIRVADAEISRSHFVIERDDDGIWWAADAGSRNGTIVDGVRAPRTPLVHGSVIGAGRSLFVFVDMSIRSGARLKGQTDGLRGESLVMQTVRGDVLTAGSSTVAVLVLGETGTGKERVAEAIHSASGRKPFVAVNCAAIPATLADTEVFGHAPGAFTDAQQKSEGIFASAHGGTLFLDEIGELDPTVQARARRSSGSIGPSTFANSSKLKGAALRAGRDPIRFEHLPDEIALSVASAAAANARPAAPPLEILVPRDATPDSAQLERVLAHFGANMVQVARYFRRDRKQIYRWVEKLDIDVGRFRPDDSS